MSVLQYPAVHCPVARNNATKRAYTVTSSFPPGKVRPRSVYQHKTYQRDIQDTMHNATLINIVAAVNVDSQTINRYGCKRDYAPETIDSFNMSAISTMLQPRDKTVSIPQPKQRIFNMPEETIQRKPVYYKHSSDQEVRKDPLIRLLEDEAAYCLKVKNATPAVKRASTTKQTLSTLPNKPHIMDINVTKGNTKHSGLSDGSEKGQPKVKSASSQRSRASSGVRRLGQVKTPPEPRKVCEIPKCDAIDLSQPTLDENADPARSAIVDSRNVIPTVSPAYIRMEALPGIFPTKRSISQPEPSSFGRSQQIYKDRPLSQSLRKNTPSSMYSRLMSLPNGSCENSLTISNGFNKVTDPNNVTPSTDSYSSPDTSSVPFSTRSSAKSLRKTSKAGQQKTPMRSNTTPKQGHHTVVFCLDNSKSELHAAVQRVMSGTSTSSRARSAKTTASRDSWLTDSSKSTVKEAHVGTTHNSPKKVHFISSTESTPVPSNKGTPVFGGLLVQKPSTSFRSFSPAIQPMSATELLRFQQRILPANLPIEDSVSKFHPSNTGITIQGLRTSESAMSDLFRDDDANENDEELKFDGDDKDELNQTIEDAEPTLANNHVEDSDQEILEVSDEDSDEYDDDNGRSGEGLKHKPEYYKLVKAVDRHTYAGFEHKKLRRSAGSCRSKDSETTKSHFVKVRLS